MGADHTGESHAPQNPALDRRGRGSRRPGVRRRPSRPRRLTPSLRSCACDSPINPPGTRHHSHRWRQPELRQARSPQERLPCHTSGRQRPPRTKRRG